MTGEILISRERITDLEHDFINAKPFSYICIDNFLDKKLADSLEHHFPSVEDMDVLYKGLNEYKGEHSTFENLHSNFTDLKQMLSSDNFIKKIETIAGLTNLKIINDRYGCGLHQGGNGSFLDIHIDYNLHPVKKLQRRLNLIIFLNKEWQKEWGGYLEFWNATRTECITSIEPKFNRAVLFICNNISFHGYSKITCPQHITRKSFYFYFFSNPGKKILFHDTVFIPPPNDGFIHKYRTKGKEFLKNTIKRILYYTGLNRFLK